MLVRYSFYKKNYFDSVRVSPDQIFLQASTMGHDYKFSGWLLLLRQIQFSLDPKVISGVFGKN